MPLRGWDTYIKTWALIVGCIPKDMSINHCKKSPATTKSVSAKDGFDVIISIFLSFETDCSQTPVNGLTSNRPRSDLVP